MSSCNLFKSIDLIPKSTKMIRANIIGLIVNDFNLKLFNFCSRFSLLLLLLMVIASVAIESWHFNEADISDDVDVGGFLDDTPKSLLNFVSRKIFNLFLISIAWREFDWRERIRQDYFFVSVSIRDSIIRSLESFAVQIIWGEFSFTNRLTRLYKF